MDVEPTVFWNGDASEFEDELQAWMNAVGFIEGDEPGAHGVVSRTSPSSNGSSGTKVEDRYLTPLGMPTSSLPRRPGPKALVRIALAEFCTRLIADLESADAEHVITLGDEAMQVLAGITELLMKLGLPVRPAHQQLGGCAEPACRSPQALCRILGRCHARAVTAGES